MQIKDFIAICQNNQTLHKLLKEDTSSPHPTKEGLFLIHESYYGGEAHLAFLSMTSHTLYWHRLQAHDIDSEELKPLFDFCEADKDMPENRSIFPIRIPEAEIANIIDRCKPLNKSDKFYLKSITPKDDKGNITLNFIVGYDMPFDIPAEAISTMDMDKDVVMNMVEHLVYEARGFSANYSENKSGISTYPQFTDTVLAIMKVFQNLKQKDFDIVGYTHKSYEYGGKDSKEKYNYVELNHFKYLPRYNNQFGVVTMVGNNHREKLYLEVEENRDSQ